MKNDNNNQNAALLLKRLRKPDLTTTFSSSFLNVLWLQAPEAVSLVGGPVNERGSSLGTSLLLCIHSVCSAYFPMLFCELKKITGEEGARQIQIRLWWLWLVVVTALLRNRMREIKKMVHVITEADKSQDTVSKLETKKSQWFSSDLRPKA